jgi:hypothetical protein
VAGAWGTSVDPAAFDRQIVVGHAGEGERRQVPLRPWYSRGMRKVALMVVLVLLVAVGGWFIVGGGAPRTGEDARVAGPRAQVEVMVKDRPSAESEPAAPVAKVEPSKRERSKQEREAMRRKIVEAMQVRDVAAAEPEGGASHDDEDGRAGKAGEPTPRSGRPRAPDEETPTPGNLIDRTGNHGHMVKVMNEDLMPLVDECYALARETQPELTGLLVLDVEMIGDEDIGGVIETAVLGQGNEIVDPALVECVQESLLSTTLPPPPEGGKDAISLQMKLEPEEG